MEWNDLNKIKLLEPIFLEKAKNKGYVCPICGSGSGPKGTGIEMDCRTLMYHCWACGYTGDVINLFGICFDIEDPHKALIEFKKYYRRHGDDKAQEIPETKINRPRKRAETDYSSYYMKCLKANNGRYLKSRGILKPLQDRFCIGFDPDWQNPLVMEKMREGGKSPKAVPTSPRVIIPTNPSSYFARDVRTEIPEKQKPYEKQNVGPVGLYGFQHADKERPVFIVEGQIDALSVYQAGGQAIAVCGAANYDRVIDIAEEFPRMILMLDMDEPGRRSQEKLCDGLDQIGASYECLSYGFHDPNEYLRKDYPGFMNLVLDRMS